MKNKDRKKLFYTSILLLVFSISIIPIMIIFGSKVLEPKIIFVHDTNLNDHSMNEYSYLGIEKSTNEWNETHNTNYWFSEFHSSTEEDELNSLVSSFIDDGTDMFIFSGYRFEYWLDLYANKLPKDIFFVYIDDGSKKYFSNEYKNIISIYFETSEASFAAGILSSMFVTNYYSNPNEWKIGMWGGTKIPSVINIMSGFESGINFFNENILENNVGEVELISPNIGWYSGSYDSNSLGRNCAVSLIDEGAKVIFPVAGGQIYDAMNAIANINSIDNNIQLIGMDSDAKIVFPKYGDYILTSVIKDFEKLTYDISNYLWNYYENGVMELNDSQGDWESGWVGITDEYSEKNIYLYNSFLIDENNIYNDKFQNSSISLYDFLNMITLYSKDNNLINNNSNTFK